MSSSDLALSSNDALAAACAGTRLQPYRFIHKALRRELFAVLQAAGALDVTLWEERNRLVAEVERVLAVCADHLAHENQFLHEPLRARLPRTVVPFDDDHAEHLASIDALRLLLQRVRDAGDDAAALAYELYLRLSQFVGENLAHMAEEESTMTRALWAHFSDAEIAGFVDGIHATLSPEENAMFVRWMAHALNATEQAQLLGDLRAHAPAEVFEAMSALVRHEIGAARWMRLREALDLAA